MGGWALIKVLRVVSDPRGGGVGRVAASLLRTSDPGRFEVAAMSLRGPFDLHTSARRVPPPAERGGGR